MDNAPPVDSTKDAPPTTTPPPSEQGGSESTGGGRRTTLATAALLAAFMTYLAVGIATMDIPSAAKWPDARFFPTVVCVAGYCVSALLAFQAWRSAPSSTPFDRETHDRRQSPRWRSVVMAIATFVAFAATLEPAGWLLAGTLLFWGIAVSLGSRRFLFDAAVAAVVSSSVQLAFSAGLGLHLPVGILGAF